MRKARLQISNLHLRAPGLSREQAARLGRNVAERLAETPFDQLQSQQIRSLKVQVGPGAGSSVERLADEIASQIRRRIG